MTDAFPPTPSKDDAFFWDAVRRHKLVARRCSRCETLQHPPEPMCWKCHSTEFEVEELTGRGRVHSWIVAKHPTQPDANHRVVALVELDDGVRIVSNIDEESSADVYNGAPVSVVFRDFGNVTLPQFVIEEMESDRG